MRAQLCSSKLVVVHSQVASGAITQVGTVELLQTLAANTAAPFILCSRLAGAPQSAQSACIPHDSPQSTIESIESTRLRFSQELPLLALHSEVIGPKGDGPYGHIVNVSPFAAVSLSDFKKA